MVAAPASAYSAPAPAGGTLPMVPVAAYLTLALYAGQQQRRAEVAERRLQGVHQLFTREDVDPAQARSFYVMSTELGAWPGDPYMERPHEFKGVFLKECATKAGMAAKTFGAHVDAWTQSSHAFEKKVVTVRHMDADGIPRPRTLLMMAPTPALRDVVNLPAPERTQRQKADTARREKAKEARCPICGSTDVDVRCRHQGCGAITVYADLPDATHGHGAVADPRPQEPLQGEPQAPHGAETALNTRDDSLISSGDHGSVSAPWAGPAEPDDADEPDDGVEAPQTADEALSAAVDVVLPAVSSFGSHIKMLRRQQEGDQKYSTVDGSLTDELLRQHFQGQGAPRGTRLCELTLGTTSGRLGLAIAWDADDVETWKVMLRGAYKLARAGLVPLVSRQTTEEGHGHLWLFLDEPMDPSWALAAAETAAPELRTLVERYPNPKIIGDTDPGGRLCLPGGVYWPVGGPAVPKEVGLVPRSGPITWASGTQPEGWAIIGKALSQSAILRDTWVPPEHRPTPVGLTLLKPQAPPASRPRPQTTAGEDFFRRFNAQNPVRSLVKVNAKGMFKSPWHEDSTPSCKLDKSDVWCDFSRDRRGGDSFDLWATLNGFWPDNAEKPDRRAAYRALNPQQPKEGQR